MKIFYPDKLSQTRIWITESLFQLMKQTDYTKITVTEISQTAGVARRTFYLNYLDKEDVLRSYVNALFDDYRITFLEQHNADIYTKIHGFFKYWYNNRDFLLLLKKNNLFYLLLDIFKTLGEDSIIFTPTAFGRSIPESQAHYFVNFVIAGLWELLGEWISNDTRYTPQEMTDLFFSILFKL